MSLLGFSNQVPNVFDRFFDSNALEWANRKNNQTQTSLPAVNIKENSDAFELEMAIPGFVKEDFKIELNNRILTVTGEKKQNQETEESNYSYREFSYASFSRSFTLPNIIESEMIKASYDNGVLHLNIPKKEEVKPKPIKHIEIV